MPDINLFGQTFTNVEGFVLTDTNGDPCEFKIPETIARTFTENGTYNAISNGADGYHQVTINVPQTISPNAKNVQVQQGYDVIQGTTLEEAHSITVSKTGRYVISWTQWRSSTASGHLSRLYINDVQYGNNYTSYTSNVTYGGCVLVDSVSLNEGDVVSIKAKAATSTSYICVANLMIVEK